MNDNPNTKTVVSRDSGNVVLIEIFCASPRVADDVMRHVLVAIEEGREVRIKLPNVTIQEEDPHEAA